jgi:hypothetical protein
MISAIADAPFVAYTEDAPTGLTGTIGVQVKDANDNVVVARTTEGITEVAAGSGIYQWNATAPQQPGPYVIIWDTGGATPQFASELFQVTPGSAYVPEGDVTAVADLTDLAVLIPWARRACEGPFGPQLGQATLADDQVYPMIADAASEIVLYSGSLFGQNVNVTQRDPIAGYPIQWKTDRVLTQWEGAIIISQVALDYWRFLLPSVKISESIKNEGTEWVRQLSANVIRDYLKMLQSERDNALKGLRAHNPVLDRYASNIRVRDQATVAILEWWDNNAPDAAPGLPGGQEAAVIPWTPGWSGPGFTP